MAEIRTFTGFKDWMLVILLGGNLAMQFNTNSTVNTLATNSAVMAEVQKDYKDDQAKIEAKVDDLATKTQQNAQDIASIKEYLKPGETRENRKTTHR